MSVVVVMVFKILFATTVKGEINVMIVHYEKFYFAFCSNCNPNQYLAGECGNDSNPTCIDCST